MKSYAIRFDFPDGGAPFYAGAYKGGLGWAPTLATAFIYDDADTAARVLTNGYGKEARKWGRVIQVKDMAS